MCGISQLSTIRSMRQTGDAVMPQSLADKALHKRALTRRYGERVNAIPNHGRFDFVPAIDVPVIIHDLPLPLCLAVELRPICPCSNYVIRFRVD